MKPWWEKHGGESYTYNSIFVHQIMTKTLSLHKQRQMYTYMDIEKYGRLPARWLHGSGRKGRKRKQASKKKKSKRLYWKISVITSYVPWKFR